MGESRPISNILSPDVLFTHLASLSSEERRAAMESESRERLLILARDLSDHFRLRDWEARLHNAGAQDLCKSIRLFACPASFQECLRTREITLVFTSHPSEIRPTEIMSVLTESSDALRSEIQTRLAAVIPKVRSERPAVADEVAMLVAHFERVIIDGVIDHCDRVQTAAYQVFDESIHEIPCLFRFHTWVGADRDGNPAITAEATYEAGMSLRRAAMRRYRSLLQKLAQITVHSTSPAWHSWLHTCEQLLSDPYLRIGKFQHCFMQLEHLTIPESGRALVERFTKTQALFGLHLASIEWRENSSVILQADQETCRGTRWAEQEFSSETRDLLASLRVLARLRTENGCAAVGALIISNCETAEVVFALERLARKCGVFDLGVLPIVPLLESIAALETARQIVEQLLQDEHIRSIYRATQNRIQVMLGYSDAAKNGGRFMADAAISQAQADITEVAARYHVMPFIFHGRGGSPGRGYVEIRNAFAELHPALPRGILKQTEQGEVVLNRYGHPRLAASSFDQWFLHCLHHAHRPLKTAAEQQILRDLAVHAFRVYRALRDAPDFLEHLLLLTPLAEVCHLPLSSRPAARLSLDGTTSLTLERLRAIPLNFAMNIAGIQLLAWYGTGSALNSFLERKGAAELRQLYTHDAELRVSLDRAAQGLLLSRVDEFCAQARDRDNPSVRQFVEKIETEALRLRNACTAIGITLPEDSALSPETGVLWDLTAVLARQDASADHELAATVFAAVAASIGMTG